MKNKIMLSLLALFIMLGVAVQAAENSAVSPAGTVEAFFTTMAKGNFVAAKKYVLPKQLIDMLQSLENLAKEVPDLRKESAVEFAPYAAGKAVSVKITGDTAEVVWSYRDPKTKKIQKDTVKLKKVSGVWKITDC